MRPGAGGAFFPSQELGDVRFGDLSGRRQISLTEAQLTQPLLYYESDVHNALTRTFINKTGATPCRVPYHVIETDLYRARCERTASSIIFCPAAQFAPPGETSCGCSAVLPRLS